MLQVHSELTPELETSRLRLRTIRESDDREFFDIFSDATTLKYWSGTPIETIAQARDLVAEEIRISRSREAINWGVALPGSNRLIGKIVLFNVHEQNRRAEVGYILNRKCWSRGYMSEALQRVLEFAFGELDLHRLEADTDPENLASLALLEKFGFRREGYFRERWYVQDKWLDSVMLGLLRSEYRRPPD